MDSLRFAIQPNGVAKVVLNRPDKKNAFNGEMIARLRKIAEVINKDREIRVVNLIGEGSFFCAGADLEWMRKQTTNSLEEKFREAMELARMLKAWYDIGVPVLTGVQGGAFGGGLGLVVLSDEVIGARDTWFSFSEVRLGLIPATISPYVHRVLGNKAGGRLLLSGKIFSVEEAQSVGLVDEIVPCDTMESALIQKTASYLEGSPEAIRSTKRLLREYGEPITDEKINKTVQALTRIWEGEEAKEGINSFFSKKKPSWSSNAVDI
ncbi:MAG: enoyl-CoA hydratase-related protein [Paracoccaceae bacterium]|nr:enoyl-CoA hydratase-related protein [Paracoccaceae bacterium]MDE2917606.1 enoyl-CoA hydratase-related protein [Paracoccaceae bacterium]